MRLITLNGFSAGPCISGKINQYFRNAQDVFRFNWAPRHTKKVMSTIRGLEPYCLIGFSDGGTLAHEVACLDARCAGLIVHSGMWRVPKGKPNSNLKVLLLVTDVDKTPTLYKTYKAWEWWNKQSVHLDPLVVLPYAVEYEDWVSKKFGHQFPNALDTIDMWLTSRLGMTNAIRSTHP